MRGEGATETEHDGETASERANRRVCAIFDACRASATAAGARDAALLSVLYGAGVPRGRALRLDRSAYDARSGRLETGGAAVWAVEGARRALGDWVRRRGNGQGPLFCRLQEGSPVPGRRMEPSEVVPALRRWAERAGLDGFRTEAFRSLYRSPWWRGSCPE